MSDRTNGDPGQQQLELTSEENQAPPTPLPEEGSTPPAPGAGEAGSAPEMAATTPSLVIGVQKPPPKTNPLPSRIVGLGICLLLATGILLGLNVVLREQPGSSVGFEDVRWSFRNRNLWPLGADPYKLGGLSLSDDYQIYQAEVYTTNVMLLGLSLPPVPAVKPLTEKPPTKEIPAQEICLVVKVLIESGQPASYGIIFHGTDEQNFDLFTIEEGTKRAYFQEVRDSHSKLSPQQFIGEILRDIPEGQTRQITLAITAKEVHAWLDFRPVMAIMARKEENLASGGIGLFVISGSQTGTLPIRVNFSNLKVTPLSLSCWP